MRMSELKDNSVRYLWTIRFLFGIVIFKCIFFLHSIFSVAMEYGIISRSIFHFYDEHIRLKLLYSSFGYYFVYIGWHVFFILWLYRAYSNLQKRTEEELYAKKWFIFAWFIPLVNLFLPYRLMKNLFSTTDLFLKNDSVDQKRKTKKILLNWQILFVITIVFGWIFYFILFMGFNFDPEEFAIAVFIIQLANFLFVLSKFRLIRHYRAMELKLNAQTIDHLHYHGEDLLDQ